MKKYSIGIDFGTLSARAVLLDLEDGKEVAERVYQYPHAVMGEDEFEGADRSFALQHPKDYVEALTFTVKGLVELGIAEPKDIVGLGIDFTSSTVLPITEDGMPVCYLEEFKKEPHAYVKLWKHHGAEAEAGFITEKAEQLGEKWLPKYGGKVSSEWLLPKLLETKNKAPRVLEKADHFIEAADWIVLLLTGELCTSSCIAGYKALWGAEEGYPSDEFFKAIGFEGAKGTLITERVLPTGACAGRINEKGALLTGLCEGTAVTAPLIDAHAALPCAGIVEPGKLMMILGTSACHIIMDEKDIPVYGLSGSVRDGIAKGYVAYEAGQSGSGDNYAWFINNCVPDSYAEEAQRRGMSVIAYMTEKAESVGVGKSGLIALDWFNGCRSPYADYSLTGLILGLGLNTKPEEIFRAMLEATVFGTKRIVELYEQGGISVDTVYASGGIARKNPFLMQMYSDALGKEIRIAKSTQAGAKGSAILASVAGEYYPDLKAAADRIADGYDKVYMPNAENGKIYAKLYSEYLTLAKYFAEENHVMKRLKNI